MIIQPYVWDFPASIEALEKYAPNARRVFVGYFDRAYFLLLRQLWKRGDRFDLVEQDVVIAADTIPSFDRCSCLWATAPIPRHRPPHEPLTASLGCVRFATELIRNEPDLMIEVGKFSAGQPPGHWAYLDVAIDVLLRQRGYHPHIHQPPLAHLPPPTC